MGEINIQQVWFGHEWDGLSAKLWPSAYVTSKWLCDNPEMVRGHTVCELGAGVGLLGIVASRLGAKHVILTDLQEAVKLLAINARENADPGVRVHEFESLTEDFHCSSGSTDDIRSIVVGRLFWGDEEDISWYRKRYKIDVVLGADIVYTYSDKCMLKQLADTYLKLSLPWNGFESSANVNLWMGYMFRESMHEQMDFFLTMQGDKNFKQSMVDLNALVGLVRIQHSTFFSVFFSSILY